MADSNFSDTQNHWAQIAIQELAARNLVSGYPDGQFRPDASLTRAEFAALVQKAFPDVALMRSPIEFVDVPQTYWARSAIQTAYRLGFLSGYPGRVFQPTQSIPRVQVLVALMAGLRYAVASAAPATLNRYFDDAAQVPNYAVGAIAAAASAYLIVNYPDVRRLHPTRNATRGEVAALLCRALRIAAVPLQYVVGLDFIAIQPQFEQADAFAGGLARVKVGDHWGYIDPQGRLAIAPQFLQAESFVDGLALVRQSDA
jgi:S-layer homology domain/WG containing repeat